MKTTLAMLAVTLMKTGVCIAGVRPDRPSEWVRPVRDFGSVLLGDITYPSAPGESIPAPQRRVMRPFDLVELTLGRARPEPPHVEDWTCDFVRSRPRLLGVVPEAERAALLDAAAATPNELWTRHIRSLGTHAVGTLTASFTLDPYTGKYEARLTFADQPAGAASVPCTDLKWRALGRRLLVARQSASGDGPRTLTLAGNALWDVLGGERRCWLALGSTRSYDGRHWPLIVGVHTLPDYEAVVDYSML
jgi:hypothetical protein